MAKSLERDTPNGPCRRRISIVVGAAVLPQHAAREIRLLDVGPDAGTPVDAMRRLVAYAAQPDSDVDVVRVGMEDTPYLSDETGKIQPTNNVELCRVAADILDRNGALLLEDPSGITKQRVTVEPKALSWVFRNGCLELC
jgi:hypothetical protein